MQIINNFLFITIILTILNIVKAIDCDCITGLLGAVRCPNGGYIFNQNGSCERHESLVDGSCVCYNCSQCNE